MGSSSKRAAAHTPRSATTDFAGQAASSSAGQYYQAQGSPTQGYYDTQAQQQKGQGYGYDGVGGYDYSAQYEASGSGGYTSRDQAIPRTSSPHSYQPHSPTTTTRSSRSHTHTSTSSGTAVEGRHLSSYGRSSPPRQGHGYSQPTNFYTHCGRHSNEWLFGGHGFSDIKKFWRKGKGGQEEEYVEDVEGGEQGSRRGSGESEGERRERRRRRS